jgi:hypothetical protein
MKTNLLSTSSAHRKADIEQQTSDLLLSILESSPDAESKLKKFRASISDRQIDIEQQGKLRRIEINAATLLAVERQLNPVSFPVFSITGQDPEATLPASETAQLRAKKRHLRIWARRHVAL